MRENDRFQIEDAYLARRLWVATGLAEVVLGINGEDGEEIVKSKVDMHERWGGTVVGLNPNIRIYRYRKGQFFDKHCE